jgi:3-phenylpropionate/trans-cinnamate dioxygenase ferredoxin reductase subunit
VDEGVVIVGGGLAAARCAETLRRLGFEGRLRVVCGEAHAPYDRPPLSKELLAADAPNEAPVFRAVEWYEERRIELLCGSRASELDAGARRVLLEDETTLVYDKLVIATGSQPRTLPLLEGYANVSTLRTLEDAQTLRAVLAERHKLVVIGAGFIGQEVAAAARGADAEVSVVELAELPLVAVLGPEIGGWLADVHAAHGVELILGCAVAGVVGEREVTSLELADGREIACDHVLVGVGVVPDLDWVASAGLPSTGVPTDELGRTELPDVFAAGDAAAVYDPFLARHVLAGHWEAAARHGVQVATTILGHDPAPAPLSSFWSDQYGKRIQYLGHAELADSMEIDGELEASDFVAHYTRAGELVAALAVGRPRAVGELRERLRYMTERTAV